MLFLHDGVDLFPKRLRVDSYGITADKIQVLNKLLGNALVLLTDVFKHIFHTGIQHHFGDELVVTADLHAIDVHLADSAVFGTIDTAETTVFQILPARDTESTSALAAVNSAAVPIML